MTIKRKIEDRAFTFFTALCTAIVIVPLLSLLYVVFKNGISALSIDFLFSLPKPVGEAGGGIGNAVQGTIMLVLLSVLISTPIGLLAGIYLAEFRETKLTHAIRIISDALTSTPSIVAGLFGYTFVVLKLGNFSAFAGAAALSLLMLPVIVRTTDDSLKLVPFSLREAGLALGIRNWRTIISIALPAAKGGIITGLLLSIARISGETAPLLFTAFGSSYWATGIDKPVSALPLLIYTYATSPFTEWHAQAFGAALVLIVMVLMLNIAVRFGAKRK